MANEWDRSADAWIAQMGEHGDFARRHVLDPEMFGRVDAGEWRTALDVGCGEGRFCRALRARGIDAVGIDPTAALLARASAKDPAGAYVLGRAEAMAFAPAAFDLVVSYLTLIDIPDFQAAIDEMHRVLRPGGTLLIANCTSFNTAGMERGWITDAAGARLYYPVDRYMEERAALVSWSGIEIENWHRPLHAYMAALLGHGFVLSYFSEPVPRSGDPDRVAYYRRAPWFLVMEWQKPAAV